MNGRLQGRTGQAVVDWLLTSVLVTVLGLLALHLLSAPLRRLFLWAADCITLDRCGPLVGL